MEAHKLGENILTIDGVWSPADCDAFIAKSEAIGYEPATVETGNGPKRVEHVRNNNRVIYKDDELAIELWGQLKAFVPQRIGNSVAIGLNELFRSYKYEAGQEFKRHRDQSFIRSNGDASYYTLMIYLNENFEGGETSFRDIIIRPKKGSVLIFLHDLEHEGSEVRQGVKYVLRTDIMFRLEQQ